jgi:hypothetical protein
MALDILESCWKQPEIKEYILLSTDSDFVPVLQRLTEKSKLSAILVNESRADAHTAFRIYADVVVPLRHLNAAQTYQRTKKKLLETLRKPAAAGPSVPTNGAAVLNDKPAGTKMRLAKPPAPTASELMAQAERAVVRIASRTPKKHVARKEIEAQLQHIKGFKKNGTNAYLGKRHYHGLMAEVARRDQRIKVKPGRNQSASVMYVPDAD